MNFTINTTYKSAGTDVLNVLVQKLKNAGFKVSSNDSNYSEYDVSIFMAPDSKVREAKAKNPKLFCIIFDPKISLFWQLEENRAADLLIVSSIEQRDYLLKYNKNIFIYYMFPETRETKKEHKDKEKIIIGYHGNKQHLSAMSDVSWALDELAKKYPIEFWPVYNIEKLGKWSKNHPKVCPVNHVQWSREVVERELSKCDIGVVPSVLPVSKPLSRPLLSYIWNPLGYRSEDYIQRFKFSNNPGRIYVFSQLHIPVVTDFTPSSCQLIKNGESGFLVGTKESWYHALESFILDSKLRNSCVENLAKEIDKISPERTFERFLSLITKMYGHGNQKQ